MRFAIAFGVVATCVIAAPARAEQAPASPPLGDLSRYRALVASGEAMIQADDLPAAKARMTELDQAWLAAEGVLRPHAALEWRIVERTIERAVRLMDAASPNLARCKEAMEEIDGAMEVANRTR